MVREGTGGGSSVSGTGLESTGAKYKFRRGAQRTVQRLEPSGLKEGQRVFKALHANEFAGPPVRPCSSRDGRQQTVSSPKRQTGDGSGLEGAPFFVGSGGEVYDVYYRKCDDEVIRRIRGSSGDEGAVFRSFPQPSDYQSFFDYEQALLDWKNEVESALGDLHLPDIVGRYYSRPTVTAPIQELVEAYDEKALTELKIEKHDNEIDDDLSEDKPPSDKPLSTGGLSTRNLISIEETDPWDASLLPPEPSPAFYSSFEEFEEALLRWAEICNSSLSYIPPHANQLEQLIPIQSQATADQARAARQFRNSSAHLSAMSELNDLSTIAYQDGQSTSKPRPGLQHKVFFEDGVLSLSHIHDLTRERLAPAPGSLAVTFPSRRTIEAIPPPPRESSEWQLWRNIMDSWVQKLLVDRIAIHKEHNSFNKPMLPVIHGTFPTAYKTPRLPGFKPTPLRRRELTEEMLEDCYDCPEGINGKKVEFNVPLVNIEPLDFALLHANDQRSKTFSPYSANCTLGTAKQGDRLRLLAGDSLASNKGETYRVNKLKELREEQYRNRHDKLNAWYYPLLPQHVHDQTMAKLDAVLNSIPSGAKTMTLENVEAILSVPLYLDQFQDRLTAPVMHMKASKKSGTPRTLGEYIQKSIKSSMFPSLLQIYSNHANDPLFLAKLSLLVQDLIASGVGKGLVEDLAVRGRFRALSYLAHSISFFNDAPIDIYPYDRELMQVVLASCKEFTLLGSFFEPAVEAIFGSVFTHHFLEIIHRSTQSRSYVFLSLGSSFTQQLIEVEVKKLQESLKTNHKFFARFIHCISHRSRRVSSFFLFVTTRLMRIAAEATAIRTFFAPYMMDNIRQLARSRFSHTQYAAKLLWSLMQTVPWTNLLQEKYSNDKPLFIQDLSNRSLQEKEPRPLLSSLILDSCLQSLLRVSSGTLSETEMNGLACNFLWKDSYYFHVLFDRVIDSDCSLRIPRTVETLSLLLARLSQALVHLKLTEIPLLSKKDVQSRVLFTFTESKAKRLLSFISSIAADHPLSYLVKTNLLLVLRNLIKAENAYPMILTIPDFFTRLAVFCKDSTNQAFCRAAWGTLFTAIQRHAGVLEYMIEKGIIANFFEIISVVSGNVIIQNAIRYINKVFYLHTTEMNRIECGKEPKRHGEKGLLSVEKDVRALCKFFRDRKMFIKFQMISKRFIENPDPSLNYPGAAFTEVVRLYRVISMSPACEKLKKDIFRNEEYKQSFLAIIEKYGALNKRDPSGLPNVATMRPRAAGARLPAPIEPAVDSSKKGTPKPLPPGMSSPVTRKESTVSKKDSSDSPKRKWFMMKKKKDSKDATREHC